MKRIEWVDIYKGIAIVLVVLGHATGKFNGSIYQFHMAAFFYISGYIAIKALEQESIKEFLTKKIMSLIVPCFTMTVLFGGIYSVLERMGFLLYWDGTDYAGIRFLLREFLTHGNIYISCLGATWFIFVLFGIFIFHKACNMTVAKKSYFLYGLISLLLYVLGAYYITQGRIIRWWWFDIVLLLLTQFFFMMGILSKKYNILDNVTNNTVLMITGTVITAVAMYELSKVPGAAVDLASHTYYDLVLNSFTSMNGIFFVISLSNMFAKMLGIKKIMMYLGKNSLGILFLHFAGMKLSYAIMAAMRIVPWDFVRNLVPTAEIGNQYWWMILPISLIFSVLVWELMKRVPLLNVCIGTKQIGRKKNVKNE